MRYAEITNVADLEISIPKRKLIPLLNDFIDNLMKIIDLESRVDNSLQQIYTKSLELIELYKTRRGNRFYVHYGLHYINISYNKKDIVTIVKGTFYDR